MALNVCIQQPIFFIYLSFYNWMFPLDGISLRIILCHVSYEEYCIQFPWLGDDGIKEIIMIEHNLVLEQSSPKY